MSKTITINPELFKIGKTKKVKPLKPAVTPKMIKKTLIKRIKEHRKRKETKIEAPEKEKEKDDFFDSEKYLNNILKNRVEKKDTLKNHTPLHDYKIPPIKKEVENIIFKPDDTPRLNLNYKLDNEVEHGCLKRGLKQCYRSWKNHKQPPVQPIQPEVKIQEYSDQHEAKHLIESEINKAINGKTQFTNVVENRDDKLVISDEDIKIDIEDLGAKEVEIAPIEISEFKGNNEKVENVGNTETSQNIESDAETESIVKVNRVTKVTYTVGKNNNKVGVIIPGKKTRKRMIERTKDLKKLTTEDMKKTLRKKGLIKAGSSAPIEIVRKIFENTSLAGEVINEDKDILLHNLLNSHE